MGNLPEDLRYAVRMLARRPGFTAVTVLTLALGIGANSTIFTFVNAILVQPLPYHDSERLVIVWATNPKRNALKERTSVPDFVDWRGQNQVFEEMVATWPSNMAITRDGDAEVVRVYSVTAGLFRLLGVGPTIGRSFVPAEEQAGGENVAVLLYNLWQRRYGSDPGILGRKVLLDEEPYTVIGVMPPRFRFANRAVQVLIPLARDLSRYKNRGGRSANSALVWARLKHGVTLDQAQAEMDVISRRLAQQYPDTNEGWGVKITPVSEHHREEVRTALLVLLGAVGFVLLIACANVTSLLLARTVSREKEIAIRCALGAGWRDVLRQVLAESLVLAACGGVLGLLLAYGGVRYLLVRLPEATSRGSSVLQLDFVGIDGWVLGFTLAVSLLTALLVGLVPALQAGRPNLNEALKDVGTTSAGGLRGRRTHNLLIVSEVAIALILVIGAGLMLQSLVRLQKISPGFRKENVLTATVIPRWSIIRTKAQHTVFFGNLLERIERLPGVQSAAATGTVPLDGSYFSTEFKIKERPAAGQAGKIQAVRRAITSKFFHAMGIPLLGGRTFSESDAPEKPLVAIVDEELARRYFAGDNPIGKHLVLQFREPIEFEIVGLVGSVRDDGLQASPQPVVYFHNAQDPGGNVRSLVIRTKLDPMRLVPLVRSELKSLDPDVPLHNVRSLEQLVDDSTWNRRLATLLLSSLAGLALFLAALGVYGVMQYSVTQQTREIGVRIALGAEGNDVLRLVVARGLKLAALGVAIGLAASFALTRLLAAQLYSIQATDAATYSAVSVFLIAVAMLASYLPARRATKIDPIVALRYE